MSSSSTPPSPTRRFTNTLPRIGDGATKSPNSDETSRQGVTSVRVHTLFTDFDNNFALPPSALFRWSLQCRVMAFSKNDTFQRLVGDGSGKRVMVKAQVVRFVKEDAVPGPASDVIIRQIPYSIGE